MLLAAVKLRRGARGAAIEWLDRRHGSCKLDLSAACAGRLRGLGSVKKLGSAWVCVCVNCNCVDGSSKRSSGFMASGMDCGSRLAFILASSYPPWLRESLVLPWRQSPLRDASIKFHSNSFIHSFICCWLASCCSNKLGGLMARLPSRTEISRSIVHGIE
jgi:hypothetical protein